MRIADDPNVNPLASRIDEIVQMAHAVWDFMKGESDLRISIFTDQSRFLGS